MRMTGTTFNRKVVPEPAQFAPQTTESAQFAGVPGKLRRLAVRAGKLRRLDVRQRVAVPST